MVLFIEKDFFEEKGLREKEDFSLRIIWRGNEDKPFYRAHFVSKSLSDTLDDRPFWGNGVLEAEEFAQVVKIVDESGIPIQHEVINNDHFGYFVEIRYGEKTDYCFLGFSQQTLMLLEQLMTAFKFENREPVRTIIERIRLNLA
ncbi:MAG: hypothetical protein V1706_11555 [Pseudomonadota bacterium]